MIFVLLVNSNYARLCEKIRKHPGSFAAFKKPGFAKASAASKKIFRGEEPLQFYIIGCLFQSFPILSKLFPELGPENIGRGMFQRLCITKWFALHTLLFR